MANKPFDLSNIIELKNIEVSSKMIEPPLTCCSTKNPSTGHKLYGDYILISNDMNYTIPNIILSNYDGKLLTSDHTPVFAVVTYQPVIQPISQLLLIGDYKNLQRCKSNKFNIINNVIIYIKKLNKLNKQDYSNFTYKNNINYTGYLYNDIKTKILQDDKIKINEIRFGKSNKNRIWIIFDNINSFVKYIDQGDLIINNGGIGVLIKNNGSIIKENIYLLFFLLNFDFKIQYNGKLLIDAFINEINKF